MSETRSFRFRSRPEAVSAARRALDGFDLRADAGLFYDASLCVSELVTNAVLHGDIGPEDELRLDVTIDEDRLLVSVTDTGSRFTPPEPSLRDESGWGLYIVDRLSHRWGVERRRGTRVWFEMTLPVDRAGERGSVAGSEEADHPEEVPERGLRRRAALSVGLRAAILASRALLG